MKLALLALLLLVTGCSEAHPRDTALRLGFEGERLCSGTAVGDDVILTADHCFANDGRLVSINGQPAYALKIERDGQDHVLVRVSKRFKYWARIGDNPPVRTRVYFWGNAHGLEFAYREAYVSLIAADKVLYDGMSAPGDSGAGLFNAKGVLVGVVSGSISQRVMHGEPPPISFLWSNRLKFSAKQYREMR